MKAAYNIFEGDGSGIVFVRSDTAKMSKVTVKSEASRHVIRSYAFRNVPNILKSPYISWANLNCCGGWTFDKNYLLTAVQEGKKLCAGITLPDENAVKGYIANLSGDYPHFCPPPMRNGPHTFYHIDVTRKGCIADYICMADVRQAYSALGIDSLDFGVISEYTAARMIHLMDGTVPFDYANPEGNEQFVVTGLLLGYPLESTAALLLQ